MKDRYRRPVNYMRISVTDRCNLRCFYCMPEEGICKRSHNEILRYEEIARIVEEGVKLGINRIRITGGEPLVRPDIEELVGRISSIRGIEDISLTTNGLLLKGKVRELKKAGLRRVNISLDSLDPEKYRRITGSGNLEQVMEGINLCIEEGLNPVKINVVLLKGINDDEVNKFVTLTRVMPVNVRFIELMPVGNASRWFKDLYISIDQIKKDMPDLVPCGRVQGSGPAQSFRVPGARGTVGFIAALSHNFCNRCNRVRLTADGKIKPCLNSDLEVDLKPALREGKGELVEFLRRAISLKPERHYMSAFQEERGSRDMYQIGG